MLLIGPIARYLHGPGYSVWFLEAGHTVLPKRLAMMLARVDSGRPHGAVIMYQNCGATLLWHFFLLSVWSFEVERFKVI